MQQQASTAGAHRITSLQSVYSFTYVVSSEWDELASYGLFGVQCRMQGTRVACFCCLLALPSRAYAPFGAVLLVPDTPLWSFFTSMMSRASQH